MLLAKLRSSSGLVGLKESLRQSPPFDDPKPKPLSLPKALLLCKPPLILATGPGDEAGRAARAPRLEAKVTVSQAQIHSLIKIARVPNSVKNRRARSNCGRTDERPTATAYFLAKRQNPKRTAAKAALDDAPDREGGRRPRRRRWSAGTWSNQPASRPRGGSTCSQARAQHMPARSRGPR